MLFFNGAFPWQSGLDARLVSHGSAIRLTRQSWPVFSSCVYSHGQGTNCKECNFLHRSVSTRHTKIQPLVNVFSIRDQTGCYSKGQSYLYLYHGNTQHLCATRKRSVLPQNAPCVTLTGESTESGPNRAAGRMLVLN